jgi:fatty acyl-CoA reductase
MKATFFSKHVLSSIFRPPAGAFHSRKIYDRIYRTFAHWLPAYIMDFLLWASGKKPVVVKLIGKMHRGISALEYFINREWTWSNDNLVALDGDLNQTDRTLFNFCLHDLDWEDFVRHYYLGVRHNVLMYKPETIDTCRQKVRNMYLVYDFLRSIITAGVVYYFFSRIMTIF